MTSPAVLVLQRQVNELDIWDNSQRDEAMRLLKEVSSVKRGLKKEMDEAVKPFKEGINKLKDKFKVHLEPLVVLDDRIREAITEYDIEVEKAHEAENKLKRELFEKEQALLAKNRAEEFVEAKKAGRDTSDIVESMAVKEVFVPDGVSEEVNGVTSKAIKVWEVYLLNGSKWDKKKRLNMIDVVSPLPSPEYAFLRVDSSAINEMFNKNLGLPEWVKIEDSRKIIAR